MPFQHLMTLQFQGCLGAHMYFCLIQALIAFFFLGETHVTPPHEPPLTWDIKLLVWDELSRGQHFRAPPGCAMKLRTFGFLGWIRAYVHLQWALIWLGLICVACHRNAHTHTHVTPCIGCHCMQTHHMRHWEHLAELFLEWIFSVFGSWFGLCHFSSSTFKRDRGLLFPGAQKRWWRGICSYTLVFPPPRCHIPNQFHV